MATASIMVPSFAMIASEFPNDVTKIMGALEAIGGIGLILGPLIGAGLYSFLEYVLTFLVVTIFYLFMVPICCY